MKRRNFLVSGGALLALSGCAEVKAVFGFTDYLGEAAAVFTGGAVALTALNTLIQTGVITKAQGQGLIPAGNAMAAEFATVKVAGDNGSSLGSVLIQAAQTALNGFQIVVDPVVAPVGPAQAHKALMAHRALHKAFDVAAILAFVGANLGTIISAGQAIGALVQELIAEYRSIKAGETTVAQFDAAYADFQIKYASFQALVAA